MQEHTDLYDIFLMDEKTVQVVLRITRVCNQTCRFCGVEINKTTYSFEEIKKVIDEAIREYSLKKIFFSIS